MLQNYDFLIEKDKHKARIDSLRAILAKHNLDGFIIPHNDEFFNELTPECNRRLFWLTGFSGSAGLAIVLRDRAAMFVDGRYVAQVKEQVDLDIFTIIHSDNLTAKSWLMTYSDIKLSYDRRLHTDKQIAKLSEDLAVKSYELIGLDFNPIDELWLDRPPMPESRCVDYPLTYAGVTRADKIAALKDKITAKGANALLVNSYDSFSWLFNIRGADIENTPVIVAYALVYRDGIAKLYLDTDRLSAKFKTALTNDVELCSPDKFWSDLVALGQSGGKLLADPDKTSHMINATVQDSGGKIVNTQDPVMLAKAIKNGVEIDFARKTNVVDSAAVCNFLAWVDGSIAAGVEFDEITLAEALNNERAQIDGFSDISFSTISAAGANSALPHYAVNHDSNTKLVADNVYLVDSGGQYPGATTDITRTIAVGSPGEEICCNFTLVLKGVIALSRAVFPAGTRGCQLDILARLALWRYGLNFSHGTGHGVGAYLSVHESPPNIGPGASSRLYAGMIVTNEPGFYKVGHYGIRTENILLTVPASDVGADMLRFETLTIVPIDRRLIMLSLLDDDELAWLNDYHARVRTTLASIVKDEAKPWLEVATSPLTRI